MGRPAPRRSFCDKFRLALSNCRLHPPFQSGPASLNRSGPAGLNRSGLLLVRRIRHQSQPFHEGSLFHVHVQYVRTLLWLLRLSRFPTIPGKRFYVLFGHGRMAASNRRGRRSCMLATQRRRPFLSRTGRGWRWPALPRQWVQCGTLHRICLRSHLSLPDYAHITMAVDHEKTFVVHVATDRRMTVAMWQ